MQTYRVIVICNARSAIQRLLASWTSQVFWPLLGKEQSISGQAKVVEVEVKVSVNSSSPGQPWT